MTPVVERYHVPNSQVWPGSRGAAHGNVHLHVLQPTTLGRMKRKAGECLCRKKRGNYERPPEVDELAARCPGCEAVALRYGIEWPSERRAKFIARGLTLKVGLRSASDESLLAVRSAAAQLGLDVDEGRVSERVVYLYGERLALDAFPAELLAQERVA